MVISEGLCLPVPPGGCDVGTPTSPLPCGPRWGGPALALPSLLSLLTERPGGEFGEPGWGEPVLPLSFLSPVSRAGLPLVLSSPQQGLPCSCFRGPLHPRSMLGRSLALPNKPAPLTPSLRQEPRKDCLLDPTPPCAELRVDRRPVVLWA